MHVCLIVAATLMASALGEPAAAPQPRVVRFLGERAVRTLAGATRAQAFRVTDKRANEDEKDVGGYLVDAAGKEQGEEFARRTAAVLLDEKSYRFDAPPARGFKPVVGMRLWGKDGWVEVLLSPSTDEVVVFSPNPDDGSIRSAQADVAPARETLTALAKEGLRE